MIDTPVPWSRPSAGPRSSSRGYTSPMAFCAGRAWQIQANDTRCLDGKPAGRAVVGSALLDNRSNVMDDGYVKWTSYLRVVLAAGP